ALRCYRFAAGNMLTWCGITGQLRCAASPLSGIRIIHLFPDGTCSGIPPHASASRADSTAQDADRSATKEEPRKSHAIPSSTGRASPRHAYVPPLPPDTGRVRCAGIVQARCTCAAAAGRAGTGTVDGDGGGRGGREIGSAFVEGKRVAVGGRRASGA